MGSELSQSQEFRNTFPLSQYRILQPDQNFPSFTFLQRLSDSKIFAVNIIDKPKQNYEASNSKHVIKRIQRREINKKIFQLYEWANTNVQGLVEYINLVDKNRKISKAEYIAIVQGAVRGYSSISKQCFEIECLEINMQNLRIFNEVSLKVGAQNSKEVLNTILVKVIPKNLNDYLKKPQKNASMWSHVGQCIHQGGILTQKQLLGQYLIQLSNYATKQSFKTKPQSLKNLKECFGDKTFQVVEALVSNEQWKSVLRILDTPEVPPVAPLKQINNNEKVQHKNPTQNTKVGKQKFTQTQKTIDTLERNKSQKVLFHCFRNDERPTQRMESTMFMNENQQRSRVNSGGYQYKSVSPFKQEKYFSPPSVKIIREVVPPQITREPSVEDNLKLTKTNSILTILPDVFRQETNQRSRILSANSIFPQIYSPQVRKVSNCYVSPPKINKGPTLNSPRYEHDKDQSAYLNPPQPANKNQAGTMQKRKGKKISFKPSKPNPTLKQVVLPQYVTKIKPDIIEPNKKNEQSIVEQSKRNDSFLSQQFGDLKFQLSDKYFHPDYKNPSFKSIMEKQNPQAQPKVELKINGKSAPNVSKQLNLKTATKQNPKEQQPQKKHQPQIVYQDKYGHLYHQKQTIPLSHKQNTHHLNPKDLGYPPSVKEVSSEVYLMQPDNAISFKKADQQSQNPAKPAEMKESKYIGSVNIKGQKEGEGKLYFPSGGFYIGNFYKDFMHGYGKLYYPSGKIAYQGTFKYDKFHGNGKLYNQNPAYIQAFDFRNFNKIQVTEKQQPIHKEHFLISPIQKQKKNSYWKYYEGEMNYDMKHGKGVLMLENGEKFQGEFRDDLVNGKGVYYGQNGKISGRWEDNLLIEVYR